MLSTSFKREQGMQERGKSESSMTESGDLTDSYNVTASVHTVYCTEFNVDVPNSGKKKQLYFNMQKCLNNQVSIDDNQIMYFPVPPVIKVEKQVNYKLDKLNKPIEQVINLPYLNPEYIPFYPIELESQFMYRFNTCSEPLFQPDFIVQPQMQITVFTPTLSNNQKNGKYSNTKQQNNNNFKPLKHISIEQHTICTKFLSAKQEGTVRSLQLMKDRNNMNVLLLHDFFQTPLHLIPVINYLSSKNCEMNVIVPYMADFTQLVYDQTTDEMLYGILHALTQYVKCCFNGEKYYIVCQGTSTLYGLTLQKQDLNCVKNIVMNPLIKMKVKQKKPKGIELEIKKQSVQEQEDSEYSGYPLSTSESNERGDTVSDKYSSTHEHISAIKYQPNQISLIYNKKGKQDKNENGTSKSIEQGQDMTKSQQQKKSQLLNEHKFSHCDKLVVNYNTVHLYANQKPEDNQPSRLQGIEDVNKCLQELYCNKDNIQTVLNLLGVKSISYLILPSTLDEFINIYSSKLLQYKRQDQFYQRLFGLYAFSPLAALHGYKHFKDVCDNYFFQKIEELQYSVSPQIYKFDGPQNVVILVSTNSCLMTREQLACILDIDEQNININARTVLGAGQDLFFTGAGLIENILTSNG